MTPRRRAPQRDGAAGILGKALAAVVKSRESTESQAYGGCGNSLAPAGCAWLEQPLRLPGPRDPPGGRRMQHAAHRVPARTPTRTHPHGTWQPLGFPGQRQELPARQRFWGRRRLCSVLPAAAGLVPRDQGARRTAPRSSSPRPRSSYTLLSPSPPSSPLLLSSPIALAFSPRISVPLAPCPFPISPS